MKTNKSFTKRLKVTKNGKILSRKTGQNHFNAKESGTERRLKHQKQNICMKNKDRGRFLNNA